MIKYCIVPGCGNTFECGKTNARSLTCSKECSIIHDRQRERARKKTHEYKAQRRKKRQRPDVREKERAYKKKYRKCPTVRAHENKQYLARYHRMGGHGYRRALPALLVRDGYFCGICGDVLPQDLTDVEVDHIVPVIACIEMGWSEQQINDLSNLQPAHKVCNGRKNNRWDGTLPGEPPRQLSLFE